jgi:prophage tail gpP-like protein
MSGLIGTGIGAITTALGALSGGSQAASSSAAQSYTVSGRGTEIGTTTLEVDGQIYSGWQEIKLTRSLENAAAQFELSVTELWPLEQNAEPWRIMPGKACVVKVSGDVVLTGWVDSYAPSFNASTHGVKVTGRSKTCDFVDSSVNENGGQFKAMTLEAIAKRVAEPFGLTVKVDPSFNAAAETIPEVQVQQGETCFELVEKLCRLQECLITDDEDGALVLTRAGAGKCSSRLVQGVNALVASATLNNAQRFQLYVVKAQRPGGRTQDDKNPDIAGGGEDEGDEEGDDDYGDEKGRQAVTLLDPRPPGYESPALRRWRADMATLAARRRSGASPRGGHPGGKGSKVLTQISGGVTDPEITRYRLKVIVAESQADAAEATKRADWECRRRIGKSIELQITVVGWRQADGRLWKTNEMVRITAPWLSIDRELVIGEVAFNAGSDGETTALKLTLPDAFLPEKTRQAKKAATGAKKDPYPDVVPIPSGGGSGE